MSINKRWSATVIRIKSPTGIDYKGPLAQLGARFVRNEEVVGSNPIWSMKKGLSFLLALRVIFFCRLGMI